jgi:ParB family chromosome partitioning protein
MQPRRSLDTPQQEQLVQSIRQMGILQPIAVRYLDTESIYQIISGERRFQAARQAGLVEIPCWIQQPKDNEVLLRQLTENWQRLELHPYELADALARIRDANGYSQTDLARVTGKPKSEISKLLALLTVSPEVQKLAREENTTLSKRHLYAVSQVAPERQLTIVETIRDQGLTAVEAERIIAKANSDKQRGAPTTLRRFVTRHATILFRFRKREVKTADVVVAIDEIRTQLMASEGTAQR